MKKCGINLSIEGDDDVWYERQYMNKKNGKIRTYFVSSNTGNRTRDEPPTGASKVVYLSNNQCQLLAGRYRC